MGSCFLICLSNIGITEPDELITLPNLTVEKIVLLSTVSIYGKINTKSINERTKINEQDDYGKTKFIMENDLKKFSRKHGISYTILRLPGVIGKNSKHKRDL